MKFMKCTLLAVLILAWQAGASAQELTPDALAAKYPSGSIQTQETAEQALREVDQQRGATEQKFAEQQHDCYSRFFATKCLDAAKEERRVSLAQIRKVEVDANAYIRAARVVERDRNLAEKRARDAANPPKPLTEVAAPKQNSQSAPHDPDEGEHRIAAHEAKVKAQQQNEAAKVSERAAKFEAYNKKVADAEKRQQEVAQKKAEKQQEAEQKAAKAAKSQQDAAQAKAPASSSAAASTPVPAAKP